MRLRLMCSRALCEVVCNATWCDFEAACAVELVLECLELGCVRGLTMENLGKS